MDEKTEILSPFEVRKRLKDFADLFGSRTTPIYTSNALESVLSATPGSEILSAIRASKPATKALLERSSYPSEATLLATSASSKSPRGLYLTNDKLLEWLFYQSEAMLSATSASSKLPSSFGLGNPSESFDPICNLRGDEGIGKGIGGGWGNGPFFFIEGIGLLTRRFCDPVEFGFSHVGYRVEHRGESSSGGGGSGVENAGEQSSGGGNGNEGIGGGWQGGGIEGRQGGLRAGGHGGGNRDDDDGNNGGGRRIGDIENGWMSRILREQNLAMIFLPVNLQVVSVCFDLDDANLYAFDSVLRCFALVCCLWSSVLFMNSVLERDERAARNLSTIGAILTALGLISITAVRVPPNLRFINGLAFLHVLAIFRKAYLA